MSGFVVCTKCGTRIKAGRGHCLRCFEPLPDPDDPVRPPVWQSLGLSSRAVTLIGVGVPLLVVVLVGVIWFTWPEPVVDDVAKPGAAPSTRGSAPVPAPLAPARDTGDEPAVAATAVTDAKPAELTAADRADLESLRAKYEKVLAETPDDVEALNSLGQTLMRLERPSEAMARFSRAIALAPNVPGFHVNLARAAASSGDTGLAIEQYREAVRILPNDYAARYTLALALQKHGEHEAALPEFQRTIELAPSDASPHLSYARSLEQLQRTPEAIREYQRFLQMRPAAREADEVKARVQTLGAGRP